MIWVVVTLFLVFVVFAVVGIRASYRETAAPPPALFEKDGFSSVTALGQVVRDYWKMLDDDTSDVRSINALPHPKKVIKEALQLIITITQRRPNSSLHPLYLSSYYALANFRDLSDAENEDLRLSRDAAATASALRNQISDREALTEEQQSMIDELWKKAQFLCQTLGDIAEETGLLQKELQDIDYRRIRLYPQIRLLKDEEASAAGTEPAVKRS